MDAPLKKELMDDLDRFVKRREFYRRVGKAWKPGYLLYPPPGTGKSSLIAAIANYLNFSIYDLELTNIWTNSDLRRLLVSTSNRSILVIEDIDCSVELPNRQSLKKLLSNGTGLVDGLEMGNNTKAAIMRIGLREMRAFSRLMFTSVRDSTFFESCGVADLITTCLGGRNRKVVEAFAKNGGKRCFDELEAELLQGQKLQWKTRLVASMEAT
ncbi:hypothetical protein HHK36_027157 [Tetracentron sinense]|uniref:glycerol-3-phosphate dehydrogenase (NAD(+)) n=1 Tax=Tetracentron sinense TaxID=13715 RepID=A0A834YKW7_TETSI|nr:hypothetical protein HHK36_027157 [Tetracentron sinense]